MYFLNTPEQGKAISLPAHRAAGKESSGGSKENQAGLAESQAGYIQISSAES